MISPRVAGRPRRIPQATVSRLPLYLRALGEMSEGRIATVSSEAIATESGVNAAIVRKDLSHLGSYGTRGSGYDVDLLLGRIAAELGVNQDQPVVIVGLGNLGRALANYGGFSSRGFRVAALLDSDPAKVGEVIAGVRVRSLEDLPMVALAERPAIAVIATPAPAAQTVVDRLVSVGVSSILNFAPTLVQVPRGVSVRQVDLSTELQILSFYQRRRDQGLATPPEGQPATKSSTPPSSQPPPPSLPATPPPPPAARAAS